MFKLRKSSFLGVITGLAVSAIIFKHVKEFFTEINYNTADWNTRVVMFLIATICLCLSFIFVHKADKYNHNE